MRVRVAGATGVTGRQLVPRLVVAGAGSSVARQARGGGSADRGLGWTLIWPTARVTP